MKELKISKELNLPTNTVTQKLAWLGTTGSGKTYGASKLAEEFFHIGAQFVVIDPVGVWYGLRLAKDGKKPSHIDIPIFGGLHGDVPLESTAGELLANLVVDKGLSCIIDVSQFESDAEKSRFATDFANKLFFRKKAMPSAMHLFLEECQEFVPQNPQRGEERMLHAFTRMQKLGRNFGIGSSYITQRPQEVNKKALNMAQTLFVFRTTGTHERAAIEKWIEDKSLDQSIAQDLPKIHTGTCHVWSPEFLKISETARILEKETFNASATPEVGETAKSRQLAPIDLDKVRAEMQATIERAKSEDPKLLKKKIVELEAKLKTPRNDFVHAEKMGMEKMEAVNKAIRMTRLEASKEWDKVVQGWKRAYLDLFHGVESLTNNGKPASLATAPVGSLTPSNLEDSTVVNIYKSNYKHITKIVENLKPRGVFETGFSIVEGLKLKEGARKMLHMLVLRHPDRLTKSQLGTLVGFKPSGGTFGSYLSTLRSAGLMDESNGMLGVTEAGLAYPLEEEVPQTPEERREMWRGRLKEGAQKMFDVILETYPSTVTKEELGQKVGFVHTGGTFGSYLSTMRSAGLIEVDGQIIKASNNLF